LTAQPVAQRVGPRQAASGVPGGVALNLGGGQVLLGPDGARRVMWALVAAERVMARDGIAPPAGHADLRAVVENAVREIGHSDTGTSELPSAAGLSQSIPSSPQMSWVDPIDTSTAAQILRCGPRNVRYLCDRGVFETAEIRGSRWLMERAEVAARAGAA
jgi:hypothetical protein